MQLGKMHQRFTYKQAVPPWRTAPPMNSARQQIQRSRRSWVCRAQPGLLNLPLDRDLELPISGFDSIKDALTELAAGKFLVVIDDEDRENEGDLIIAADKVTPEAIAYMVEYTSGVVCIGMEGKDLDRLRLPLMVSSAENEEAMYTAFTVTVDLRDGITTDRAATLQRLATPSASAAEFRRPGHIFPLRSRAGGVIVRPGHTEASVDLARLAGCFPAGALCEVVDKADGSMARTPQLLALAKAHGLKCVTIADLIRYRLRHDQLVQLTGSFSAQCRHGPVVVHSFQCCLDGSEHVLVMAARTAADAAAGSLQHPTPVHVHNASLRCKPPQ
ncbi:GTP_cyclohydro2 domain-containing protein [Haematococcus lacustris]|uniref:3,4-dihydroxy-2-butanone 4-phosphate synthase n=1 Tax=Haematococcus lacustris TaxID=44745 RepID=A0A699ZBY0_HAELA|nr:GTP_cyclohydro2 domain-containing protein [Haematococcus lacustris]